MATGWMRKWTVILGAETCSVFRQFLCSIFDKETLIYPATQAHNYTRTAFKPPSETRTTENFITDNRSNYLIGTARTNTRST